MRLLGSVFRPHGLVVLENRVLVEERPPRRCAITDVGVQVKLLDLVPLAVEGQLGGLLQRVLTMRTTRTGRLDHTSPKPPTRTGRLS